MAKSTKKNEMTVTPETTAQVSETPKETAIAPAPSNAITSIGAGDAAFTAKYSGDLERVAFTLPTLPRFRAILDRIPEEYVTKLTSIITKTMGSRPGFYGESDQADFVELRAYQGTGNDPNRPDKQIPGEFYLTTKENVGEFFEGTVIATWNGHTMWGDKDAGESTKVPVCQSMDRKMGSLIGACEECPHRPWRDNKKQRCSKDAGVFMLRKDMKEIVLVRFAKTSEPAGAQLRRLSDRTEHAWDRWFKLTLEQQTNPTDSSHRWYVMKVEPSADPVVPPEISDFCSAMCTTIEATYILPNIARIYRAAQEADVPDEAGAGSANMMSESPKDSGSLDDFGSETNV